MDVRQLTHFLAVAASRAGRELVVVSQRDSLMRWLVDDILADGVGREVVAAGRTVLDALAEQSGGAFSFDWIEFGWGSQYKISSVTTSIAQQYGMVLWDEVFARVAVDYPDGAIASAALTAPVRR